MDRIFSYNEHKLLRNLSETEKFDYFYIIEGLNENLNEGLLDRLKQVAKKGAISAALIASLSSNPAFSNALNKLPDAERVRIENVMNSNKDEVKYIDVGKNFASGEYRLTDKQKQSVIEQLKELLNLARKQGTSFSITVQSSESKVPNRDIESKESLKEGELATRRGETIQKILKEFLQNEKDFPSFLLNPVNISPIKDSEKASWDKAYASKLSHDELLKLVNSEKYTKHQFVRIALVRNDDYERSICDINSTQEGNEATADKNYVSINPPIRINVEGMYGSGQLLLDSGEIPDRVIMVEGDNYSFDPTKDKLDSSKVIGDSGYKASFEHRTYKNWKYVPAHVLKLTLLRNAGSSATMDTQLFKAKILKRGVDFKTFDELVKCLLKDNAKSYDYNNDNAARTGEIGGGGSKTGPLSQLQKLFNDGQDEFMIYEVGNGTVEKPFVAEVPYNLQGKYKKIQVFVYSPLGKTKYKLTTTCGIE